MKPFTRLFYCLLAGASLLTACSGSSEQATEQAAPSAPVADEQAVLAEGKNIAAQSFQALSTQLMAAMAEGGVPNAISYCSERAIPLTDSLSRAHNVFIRRTALKTRNPLNAPDPTERRILEEYASMMEKGGKPTPQATALSNGEILFTAPIILANTCQQCHGEPDKDISTDDYALIRSLYPEDQAVGFTEGSLRGMWAIRMYPKKK